MVLVLQRAAWQASTPLRPVETWYPTAHGLTRRGPWWRRQQPPRRRRRRLPLWGKLAGLFTLTIMAGMTWPLIAFAVGLLVLGEMKRRADRPPPYPYRLLRDPARRFRRQAAQKPGRPDARRSVKRPGR